MKKILFTLIFLTGLLIHGGLNAQPDPRGAPGPGNTPLGGGPSAPLDGGLFLLLSMASAYGIKKFRSGKEEE
ncbi:MAG: hypothetical protein WCL00_11560 [Bacteroidota bacterium]